MQIYPSVTAKINTTQYLKNSKMVTKVAIPVILATSGLLYGIFSKKDTQNINQKSNIKLRSNVDKIALPNSRLVNDISTSNPFINQEISKNKPQNHIDKNEQSWKISYLA